MNASRGQKPRVGQLMTEPALTVEASTRLQDLAASMVGRGIDSALVVEHGRLRALLTERDLVRQGLARGLGPDAQVAQVVVAAPAAVGPQASPGAALDLMLRSEQVYLPVVDEGRLVGAVSMVAVTRALSDPAVLSSSSGPDERHQSEPGRWRADS